MKQNLKSILVAQHGMFPTDLKFSLFTNTIKNESINQDLISCTETSTLNTPTKTPRTTWTFQSTCF